MRSPTFLIFALLLLALACGDDEPGSRAAIERDLEDRTMRELYEDAEKIAYTPPADGLLTAEHIKNYVRVQALADEITKIASEKLDREIESASRTDDRFSRMATAFAGIGSARAAMTAELRAALMLKMNPHEFLWTATEIQRAMPAYQTMKRFDEEIAQARAALEAETDSILHTRKSETLFRATEQKKHWMEQTGDVTLANAKVIGEHRLRLGR